MCGMSPVTIDLRVTSDLENFSVSRYVSVGQRRKLKSCLVEVC